MELVGSIGQGLLYCETAEWDWRKRGQGERQLPTEKPRHLVSHMVWTPGLA